MFSSFNIELGPLIIIIKNNIYRVILIIKLTYKAYNI